MAKYGTPTCDYCGTPIKRAHLRVAPVNVECVVCGGQHIVCPGCRPGRTRVVGEFGKFKLKARECPDAQGEGRT